MPFKRIMEVDMDYVFNCVEVMALPINDIKEMVQFLSKFLQDIDLQGHDK